MLAREEADTRIAMEQDPNLLSIGSGAKDLLFFISNTGAKPVKIEKCMD